MEAICRPVVHCCRQEPRRRTGRQEFSQLERLELVFSGADMSYFDDNNDKRVSRSEFVDKPSPIFALYDTNHDCRVTKEEINGSATPASDKSAAPRRRMGRGGGAGQSGF